MLHKYPMARAAVALLAAALGLLMTAFSPAQAQAQGQGVQPTVTSLNTTTGGQLNLVFNGPFSEFSFARLCRDVEPALGVSIRPDPCAAATATVPVPTIQTGSSGRLVFISAAALVATASSGSTRPRFAYLVLSNSLFSGTQPYAVVRINLIEPTIARSPELTEMQLRFVQAGARRAFGFFELEQTLPPVEALVRFKGNGLLRARWEVVMPGDVEPTPLDLTPEINLTPQQRAQQYRWRLVGRVQTYLSSTGLTRIPGPDPRLLPTDRYGAYSLLLRIEALSPLDPALPTQTPLLLPVLRYFIGDSAMPVMPADRFGPTLTIEPIQPLSPRGLVFDDQPLVFSWWPQPGLGQGQAQALYRLELVRDGRIVYAARVRADAANGPARFEVPAFARSTLGTAALRWRVVSLGGDGRNPAASPWLDVQPAAVRR